MPAPRVFTIGFGEHSAESFFSLLREARPCCVVDVRLNNTSQLAGFAKKGDLAFFLREILDIEYVHVPDLAPTQEILDAYKKHKGDWHVYEQEFLGLMAKRSIERVVPRELVAGGCLLCSEHTPHRCHRRLVIDYLALHWGPFDVAHLIGSNKSHPTRRSRA